MTKTDTIRRRPDGSIDTAFYLAKGRAHRGEAARDTAKAAARQSRKTLLLIATLGLSMLFQGSNT